MQGEGPLTARNSSTGIRPTCSVSGCTVAKGCGVVFEDPGVFKPGATNRNRGRFTFSMKWCAKPRRGFSASIIVASINGVESRYTPLAFWHTRFQSPGPESRKQPLCLAGSLDGRVRVFMVLSTPSLSEVATTLPCSIISSQASSTASSGNYSVRPFLDGVAIGQVHTHDCGV